MQKKLKKIPKFKNENEERKFWSKADSSEYVDWNKVNKVNLANLKPSTKSISIRLPEHLLERIRIEANKRDVPYQSLMKDYLATGLSNTSTVYGANKKPKKVASVSGFTLAALIIAFAALLLVVGSVWMFFGATNNKTTTTDNSELSTTTEPSDESMAGSDSAMHGDDTGVDTSDWQTYRNEEYGFEMRHPSSWGMFEKSYYSWGDEIEGVQEVTFPGETTSIFSGKSHDTVYVSVSAVFPLGNFDDIVERPEHTFTTSNGVKIYYADISHKGSFYLLYVFENKLGELATIALVTAADPSGKVADPVFTQNRHSWLAERITDYGDFRKMIDSVKIK